jgi:hypothetical protein
MSDNSKTPAYVPPHKRNAGMDTPKTDVDTPKTDVDTPKTDVSVSISVRSHFDELKTYPIIEQFLKKCELMPRDGWTDPATHFDNRSRQFHPRLFGDKENDFRKALKAKLGQDFLNTFSECSCDSEKRTRKDDGIMISKFFECDYFSYVFDTKTAVRAVTPKTAAQPVSVKALVQGFTASKQARLSGTLDGSKVVMFEVTETEDAIYKVCQLERDLALYELWREYQGQPPPDIAACGVGVGLMGMSVLRACVDAIDFKDFFPRIAAMNERGLFTTFCTQVLPSSQIQPLSEVWVTDGKASFPVKPDGMKVAHLKKGIVEIMKYAFAYPTLIIKNADGAVLGDKDDLNPKVEYTYVLPQ